MLTKKQLRDAAGCVGHCEDCSVPAPEGEFSCAADAAEIALIYREMLEKVMYAFAEATEVISEQLDIVDEEDLALIVDASVLLGESEVGEK